MESTVCRCGYTLKTDDGTVQSLSLPMDGSFTENNQDESLALPMDGSVTESIQEESPALPVGGSVTESIQEKSPALPMSGSAVNRKTVNYSPKMSIYLKDAENGNASAMFKIGYMFYKGEEIERDYVEAMRWFQKAAENGEI